MSELRVYAAEVPDHPGLVITVHHPIDNPRDADIEAMIGTLMEVDRSSQGVCQIVFTDGPSPNAAQRKLTSATARQAKVPPRVAVVSSNTMVRGVVTALSWLGVNGKSFSPDEVEQALAFLGQPNTALAAIKKQCQAVQAKYGWVTKSYQAMLT